MDNAIAQNMEDYRHALADYHKTRHRQTQAIIFLIVLAAIIISWLGTLAFIDSILQKRLTAQEKRAQMQLQHTVSVLTARIRTLQHQLYEKGETQGLPVTAPARETASSSRTASRSGQSASTKTDISDVATQDVQSLTTAMLKSLTPYLGLTALLMLIGILGIGGVGGYLLIKKTVHSRLTAQRINVPNQTAEHLESFQTALNKLTDEIRALHKALHGTQQMSTYAVETAEETTRSLAQHYNEAQLALGYLSERIDKGDRRDYKIYTQVKRLQEALDNVAAHAQEDGLKDFENLEFEVVDSDETEPANS